METPRPYNASEHYRAVNQCDPEDQNKPLGVDGVLAAEQSNIHGNRRINICRSLSVQFAKWRAEAEPRRSWLILVFCVIPVSIMIGVEIISFSIYYVEYVDYFEVPRSAPGFIITIRTAVSSIFGIVTSTCINRYPARVVCMSGGLVFFMAHVASSFSPNLYILYITEGAMIGIGLNLTGMTTGVLIQQHFSKNRTLGNGFHMLGLSLGYFLAPPLLTELIKVYGWRGSFLIYGAIVANIIVFASFYKQPQSSTTNQTPATVTDRQNDKLPTEIQNGDGRKQKTPPVNTSNRKVNKTFCSDILDFSVVKNRSFLLICIAAMLAKYTSSTFLQHLPNKAVTIGLTKEEAAALLSIFGITGICFRASVTVLANLRSVNRLAFYGWGLFVGAVCSYLTLIHTFVWMAIASSLQGLFLGMTNTISSVVIVEQIGVSKLAKALAILQIFLAVSAMTAIPVGGHIYDITQNYDIPYVFSGSCSIVGGAIIIGLVVCQRIERRRKHTETVEDQRVGELQPCTNHKV